MLVGYPPSPDQVHPNPFFVSMLLTSTFRASLDFLRTSMTVALQAMESRQLRPLSRLTSSEISALRSHFAWHPDGSMEYHKTIGFPVKMTRACAADSLGSPILGELLGSWGSFFEAHPHWRLQGNHTRTVSDAHGSSGFVDVAGAKAGVPGVPPCLGGWKAISRSLQIRHVSTIVSRKHTGKPSKN